MAATEGSELKLARETLTLEQSIERAFVNNPELLAKEQQLAINQEKLTQAKSFYYPQINFNMNYARYRNETLGITDPDLGFMILEAPIEDPTGNRGNPLAENLYLGRLGLKQTLYAGGRIKSTYKLTQAQLLKAESEFQSLKSHIIFKTKREFYSLLALDQKIELLQKAMDELDTLASKARGTHNKLAFGQRKSAFRTQLRHLEQAHREARYGYLKSLGMELFTEFKIEGSLDHPVVKLDLQKVLAWAKQNRPELKTTEIQQEVDRLAVDMTLAERYPVFLLGGAYEFRDQKFPVNDTNWNAVLTMDIPLFSGFSSISRIRESRYKAKQSHLNQVQMHDEIENEVRTAYENLIFWEKEMEMRRNELGFLQNERDRYSENTTATSIIEKLDYLKWNSDARLQFIDARYQLAVAYAQLEKAVGRPLVE